VQTVFSLIENVFLLLARLYTRAPMYVRVF
jgi:hypothetical protein